MGSSELNSNEQQGDLKTQHVIHNVLNVSLHVMIFAWIVPLGDQVAIFVPRYFVQKRKPVKRSRESARGNSERRKTAFRIDLMPDKS